MEDTYDKIFKTLSEIKLFFSELTSFIAEKLHLSFLGFEERKGRFAASLYRQRGKQARRLMHTGMAALSGVAMMIAPIIAQEFPGRSVDPWEIPTSLSVLSATTENPLTSTVVSEKVRDKVIEYTVQEGDTVGTIAEKFGVDEDTVLWQNSLSSKNSIKVGQTLEILPVAGISHKVQKGDTVYSIAKKYDSDAQAVVDFPYNTFINDETFELAIGQVIVVPEGVKPSEAPSGPRTRRLTPDAGSVVASGNFVWPTSGSISQNFVWYHPGTDIANRAAPGILAADAGVVEYSGCLNWGYGCHVIINHGNGFKTLYGHMSSLSVVAGQSVVRGGALGKMGSTGRSTGIHLHFEVIRNGVRINPLGVLQ